VCPSRSMISLTTLIITVVYCLNLRMVEIVNTEIIMEWYKLYEVYWLKCHPLINLTDDYLMKYVNFVFLITGLIKEILWSNQLQIRIKSKFLLRICKLLPHLWAFLHFYSFISWFSDMSEVKIPFALLQMISFLI